MRSCANRRAWNSLKSNVIRVSLLLMQFYNFAEKSVLFFFRKCWEKSSSVCGYALDKSVVCAHFEWFYASPSAITMELGDHVYAAERIIRKRVRRVSPNPLSPRPLPRLKTGWISCKFQANLKLVLTVVVCDSRGIFLHNWGFLSPLSGRRRESWLRRFGEEVIRALFRVFSDKRWAKKFGGWGW